MNQLCFAYLEIYTVKVEVNVIENFFLSGHPRFFNQLSCGLDTISLAGEWVTATANTNMFTYEIAPVFILMEAFILKKMREIIGFADGDSILAPGKYSNNNSNYCTFYYSLWEL